MTPVTDRKEDEKKARTLECLEKGMTQLHLDARRPGVLVPEKFRHEHHLVLNFSYRFDPPDLTVSDWGVRQTLSFGGSRFTVAVPWSALFALASLVTRDFWMYPDEMPEELASAATEKAQLPPQAPPAPRAMLREVVIDRSAEAPPEQQPAEPGDEPPSPPRRGHLRIVK